MSEDVSATMRVGVTVILVAALVATVLNLMVMSNSLITNGTAELQSGIDAIAVKQFDNYDNKKVSGIQVKTALDLFSARDVAIIIQTKALVLETDENTALNYCGLITKDGKAPNGDTNLPDKHTPENSTSAPWSSVVSTQSEVAYSVTIGDDTSTNASVIKKKGAAYYTGNLHLSDGLVDCNFDKRNTTEKGNAAYILDSARFVSTLIKDTNGEIIGIVFIQVQ